MTHLAFDQSSDVVAHSTPLSSVHDIGKTKVFWVFISAKFYSRSTFCKRNLLSRSKFRWLKAAAIFTNLFFWRHKNDLLLCLFVASGKYSTFGSFYYQLVPQKAWQRLVYTTFKDCGARWCFIELYGWFLKIIFSCRFFSQKISVKKNSSPSF